MEDMIEKIKRLENGGNGTNIVCFIVAYDFLSFIKETDSRERFIHEYYKNDNGMFTGNFKRICNYAESILLEDDIYKNMLKSVEMELNREELVNMYNYYDCIDRIEKANNSPKNMISDGFKIRLLKQTFDSSNKEYIKLNENVKELKNRYDKNIIDIITVLAIFIAITIGMVSGISFSLKAFDNIANTNILKVCTITMVAGFTIFNLFYSLFKFVSKLSGKDFDKNGYILFIDVAYIALIVFFILIS